jgi:hypothetical protein
LGIRFDAPADEVRAAVNRAGFRLPSSGVRTESSELELTVRVQPDTKGATLSCGT